VVLDDTKPSPLAGTSKARRMIELRKNAVKFSGGADEDVEEWLDKLDMCCNALKMALAHAKRAEADRSEELAQFLTEFDVQHGKVQVPRNKAQELLELTHDHEGRAAMFNILREFVDMPGLAAECNRFKCADCAAAKALPGDNKPLMPLASIKPAPRPFDRIHTDICGPYRQMDSGTSRFYLITAIDSCTN
ncbi:hypothetical protein FOZ63_000221, partial [Perkinsus olseni]